MRGRQQPVRPKWEDDFDDQYEALLRCAYQVGSRYFRGAPDARARAEDVAQEAVTRAFANWERATGHGCPEAWIVVTATNVCREMARSDDRFRRSMPFLSTGKEIGGVDNDVVGADLRARLLGRLTPRERAVVVWRYLLDRSEKETAHGLDMTASQVRETAHRASTKLHRLVGVDVEELL